ncbi:hypothetical protein Moror_7411 [Moniliophthora roreri MCA 2997]|uniref:Uncharacterized protein n=2 Tax=Moniliophthora roreri TaxID=221103 RepID=V2XT78_MONRO|nr:hypothetical protein Moror_7411 [Moniliophthora roreri MCA 2997]KAI3612280.1 hypothetical protein WG66_012159 [Moniliophthora roreri]
MFSTLDVDIRPGSGVGMFEIGSSLWTVLDTIRRMQHAFPQVDIKYDPDTSATTPVILHLRPHVDLLFSGKHQRLHTICIRKLRDPNPPVTLRYKDTILSSSEEILRRVGVSRTFGPTYPGDDLRYPGLWFSFDEDGIGEGRKGAQSAEDRMQEVKRVLISQKGMDKEGDALGEVMECSVMNGDVSLALVKVHDGITLHFHPSTSKPSHIRLGSTTAQDLNVILGPPLRVHYKEDDRMMIHSTNPEIEGPETSYFYNYFQHGLDFLISGLDHTVKKIVMHSNVPGTPLFQRYKRCNWEIEGKPEDDEDDTPPRKRFYDRFETISHFLSPRQTAPSMLLDRTDDEDHITLPNATTRLHGYDGIILEVSESSHVVSVTLF